MLQVGETENSYEEGEDEEAEAEEAHFKFILGIFQKFTKVERKRISGRSKRHSLLHGKIYPLMHDSITFATPFHPKNDLENRPFRASYISTRSQRRLSCKFGHEMGGDRCRGRWIIVISLR